MALKKAAGTLAIIMIMVQLLSFSLQINAQISESLGAIDMGEMLKNKEDWLGQEGKMAFTNNGLEFSGGNAIGGYKGRMIENEILAFDTKVVLDPADGWVSFVLRTPEPDKSMWDVSRAYALLIKADGSVELQKWLNKGQTILESKQLDDVAATGTYSIKFGAVNVDGGVKLHVVIDNEEVFNYLDSNKPITEYGYFSSMTYQQSSVVIYSEGGTEEQSNSGVQITNQKPMQLQKSKLSQPERWFSIPAAGIARFEHNESGFATWGLGTIGYKNKIAFEQLSFTFKSTFEDDNSSMFMLQFNKRDRTSYYAPLHVMDNSNYGYALVFNRNGEIRLIKTATGSSSKALMVVSTDLDFTVENKLTLEIEELSSGKAEFRIYLNNAEQGYVYVDEQYGNNYSDGGYLGITNIDNNCKTVFKSIEFLGTELNSDYKDQPAPLYLLDYFENSEGSYIYWRYNEGYDTYWKVVIEDDNNNILGEVYYPNNTFSISEDTEKVYVTPINIDGNKGRQKEIFIQDTSRDLMVDYVERIAIKEDDEHAYFYMQDSGTPFFIKGMNYVRLRFGDHAIFEAPAMGYEQHYDPNETEALFKSLKAHGYNTVRVFIIGRWDVNPGIAGDPQKTQGLYEPYMENVVDFIRTASKYGIYILPSFGDGELPNNHYFSSLLKGAPAGKNSLYLTEQGIEAKKHYMQLFLHYIKDVDPDLLKTFLAVQLQNELYLNSETWPFNITEGTLEMPDGNAYDMSDAKDRQALMDNGIIHYHNELVKAIKEVDPGLLVSEGVFTMKAVGKNIKTHEGVYPGSSIDPRFPPRATVLGRSDLDFLDIHIYRTRKQDSVAYNYKQEMISMDFYTDEMKEIRKRKPVIMGEFGSFKFVEETMEEAFDTFIRTRDMALSENWMGIIAWTFDTFEQKNLYHVMEDDGYLLKELLNFEVDLKKVDVDSEQDLQQPNDNRKRTPFIYLAGALLVVIGAGAYIFKTRLKG